MVQQESLNFEHIRHTLETVKPSLADERRLIRDAKKGADYFVSSIRPNKQIWTVALIADRASQAEQGKIPSNPLLCSGALIHALVETGQRRIAQYINPNTGDVTNPRAVVFMLDYTHALEMTLASIGVAEGEIAGESESTLATTVSQEGLALEEEADSYLNLEPGIGIFAKEAAQLLMKDRTAFKLLDSQVERLESVQSGQEVLPSFLYHPFEIKSFLLAGAKYAQRSYKTLYPIVESLPPYIKQV